MNVDHLKILYRIKTERGFVSDEVREAVMALMESKKDFQDASLEYAGCLEGLSSRPLGPAGRELLGQLIPNAINHMVDYIAQLEHHIMEAMPSDHNVIRDATRANGLNLSAIPNHEEHRTKALAEREETKQGLAEFAVEMQTRLHGKQ